MRVRTLTGHARIAAGALAIFVVAVAAAAAAPAAGARLMVLVARGGGVAIEALPLPASGEAELSPADLVTVLLPFGVGQSGDLVQKARRPAALRAHVADGALHVRMRQADGSWRDLPAVPLADLGATAMRVNVTGADGYRKVFRIAGYQEAGEAPGPAIDMFQGRIPLMQGDFAITTEVTPVVARAALAGDATLQFSDGLLFTRVTNSEGRTGRFAVDLGAGATVVARDFLPKGSAIEPLTAVEHSPAGSRTLPGTMAGVGGDVDSFLGVATLGTVRLGELRVADVGANVVSTLPPLGGEPLAGILGMDLLGRAERLRLARGDGDSGRLSFMARTDGPGDGATVEIPFTIAAKHLMARATLDGTPATLVIDSGARVSLVSAGLARRAHLATAGGEGRELRGLDGRPLPSLPVVVERLQLGGGAVLDHVVFQSAELPVIASLGLDPDSGLLGNDLLFRFGAVEVDFASGILRLTPGRAVTGRVVNPWTEPARETLVQHCGRCHRSDLDTSLKGALAVFDLTTPVWYANLRPDQYDGILERVHETGAIGPEDVATLEAFVACARGRDCPPPP